MKTSCRTVSTTTIVLFITLALASFSTISSAHQNETRLVKQPFLTELDAVVAAANRFNPGSINRDQEYMGVILKKGRFYYYTYTPGNRGKDKVSTLLPTDNFGKTVAFWHTHGKADLLHRYFSPSDTQLANRFKLPFYLADYTGQLKVFRPGSKTLSQLSAKRIGFYSRGAAEGQLVKDSSGKVVQVAVKRPVLDDSHSEVMLADSEEQSDRESASSSNAENAMEPGLFTPEEPAPGIPAQQPKHATGGASESER